MSDETRDFLVRLPAAVYARLRLLAFESELPMAHHVREAVAAYLDAIGTEATSETNQPQPR